MKKKDIFLIILLLAVAGSTYLGYRFINQAMANGDGVVVIVVDGEEYGSYPLSMDAKIEIPAKLGKNVLEIKNGQVTMIEADCPDQICVNHAAVHSPNEMIICLPNKIVVQIEGTEYSEIDATVQ